MTASDLASVLDQTPAKDVFLAEVFAALPGNPATAADAVSDELARKHALASIASVWTENGHTFDTAEQPESQQERTRRFGWCARCGYVIHKNGQATERARRTCAPARIELR